MKTSVTVVIALSAFTAACTLHSLQGTAPALSPDGRYVAYLEYTGQGAGYRIVVRDLTQPGGVRAIVEEVAQTQLAWSSDGRTLAYVKQDEDQRPVLWRIGIDGSVRSQTVLPDAPMPYGVAFLDADRVLVGLHKSLFIAGADGVVEHALDLSDADPEVDFGFISISSSGHIAFTCDAESDDESFVCVVRLDETPAKPVSVTSGSDITPVWRGEDELLFSRAADVWTNGEVTLRRHHLWSKNLRTGESRQLTFGNVVDSWPTIDRHGKHLMSSRIELGTVEVPRKREPEKPAILSTLEPGFATLEAIMRRSTVVTVDRQ